MLCGIGAGVGLLITTSTAWCLYVRKSRLFVKKAPESDRSIGLGNFAAPEATVTLVQSPSKSTPASDSSGFQTNRQQKSDLLTKDRTFKPADIAALVRDYPTLITSTSARHPNRQSVLLQATYVASLRQLIQALPVVLLREHLVCLLNHAHRRHLTAVVAPVLNDTSLHPSLVAILGSRLISPEDCVEVVTSVPVGNLLAVLALPPETLVSLVSALKPGRFRTACLPFLQTREFFFRGVILPLLLQVEHVEHLALMLNQVKPTSLMELVLGVGAARSASFLNAMTSEDFDPQGTLMQLLHHAATDPQLFKSSLLPLVRYVDAEKSVVLLRKIRVDRLLPVLREVDVDHLILLLEHTKAELAARLLNGPLGELQESLAPLIGGVASIMRLPAGSFIVRSFSDALNMGLNLAARVCSSRPEQRSGSIAPGSAGAIPRARTW